VAVVYAGFQEFFDIYQSHDASFEDLPGTRAFGMTRLTLHDE
jgi:hypothetical protein